MKLARNKAVFSDTQIVVRLNKLKTTHRFGKGSKNSNKYL